MLLLAIVALALAGAAIGLLAWGVALPRSQAVERMRQIGAYGFSPDADAVAVSAPKRRKPVLSDLARNVGDGLARRFGRYEEYLRRNFVAAAMYRVAPRTFMGYQALGAVVIGGLAGLAAAEQGVVAILLAALAALIVAGVPVIVVRGRARIRMAEIDRTVPDLIDMLVVTIEAGLGFGASVQASSTRIKGPLGDELMLAMQEQRMGLAIREALAHLQDRVPTPNVQSFVRAVTQGEALGVSIGTVMRNLAKEMRIKRRQSAEERAQKAPVKMLFPLVFLMFPALGIVILGPAVIEITQKLGGT